MVLHSREGEERERRRGDQRTRSHFSKNFTSGGKRKKPAAAQRNRIPVPDPESGSTCARSSAVKQHALESVYVWVWRLNYTSYKAVNIIHLLSFFCYFLYTRRFVDGWFVSPQWKGKSRGWKTGRSVSSSGGRTSETETIFCAGGLGVFLFFL